MTRANKALVVMVIGVLGLWGCAQGPATSSATLERIKALEGKCTKLEDDYRAVASARDQLRKKLSTTEEDRARVQQERQGVAKERDELKQQLTVTQGQFEQFRQNLKALLGQMEAASPGPAAAPTESKGDETNAKKTKVNSITSS
jgi:septal ring factor EnvC (AmiA/AmiB activator)